uniref:DUF1279 domain-containing protein n=1 Tax=Globodera rostochiensis TaxID=31243 RepID=A0A914HH30_GLORO
MSIPNGLFFVGRVACRPEWLSSMGMMGLTIRHFGKYSLQLHCFQHASVLNSALIRLWSPQHGLVRLGSSASVPSASHQNGGTDRKRIKFGRLTMSKELYERKMRIIEAQKEEKVPEKFFAKIHYYFKRYWYIALPVHFAVCSVWFAALYFAIKSGMDVVALLERLHLPDHWVDKVRNVPPSAGYAVAALILYKIATPFRYACTLVGIRLTFNALRRWGKLRTTREIDLTVRQRLDLLIERQRLRRRTKKAARHQNSGNGKKQSSSRTRIKLD